MKDKIRFLKGLPAGVKASIAFFAASVTAKGISYFLTPVYTRLLSPAEYGQTAVFLLWVNIFGIIAMFSLSTGVFNNGMIDYPEKRDEYSFSMLIFSNLVTVCFSVGLLCLYPFSKGILKTEFPFVVLMCVLFLFQPAYDFWTARQRYELKYKYVVLWTVVSSVVSHLLAVVCILRSDDEKLYARIFGAKIPLLVIYIGFYIYLARKSKCKVNTSYWKSAFLFNLPLIPHYLSTVWLGGVDKLMISWLVNDVATAYYSVAHSVATVITIVWTAIHASLLPYTYEKCKKKDYTAVSRVVSPILTVFAGVCIALMMFAPEMVAIMATSDYMEAIYVIPPIVGGVFFLAQYFIYANVLYYHKKPRYVMYSSVTAMVLNLILNYFFVSKYGYIAAGYTTLVCYFVQATLDYLAMKKVVKEPVYDMKRLGKLALAVTVAAVFGGLLYKWTAVRYIIILLLAAVCFVTRKRILGLWGEMKKTDE